MNPVPVGTSIRIARNSNDHDYRIDAVYTVSHCDGDGTLKASDSNGVTGNWLLWEDCEPIGIGWDWLRLHLPADDLDLLCAFNGVESLCLKVGVRDRIILTVPNLRDAIFKAACEVPAFTGTDNADDNTLRL
jgi:hypothetical protein